MKPTSSHAIAVFACAFAVELCAFLPAAVSAPPQVVAVYPVRQRVEAPAAGMIEVLFNQTIDPASVDNVSFHVFGRWSGPAVGSVAVVGTQIRFTPSEPFFAGEWVTVSVSKGVRNLAGEGLAKGYAFNFWIETVGTLLDLEYIGRVSARQANEGFIQIYGAYAGDLDNDGWSDLAVPAEQTSDLRVFHNNAGTYGPFVVESLPGGNVPSPNEGADFDNDGEIDVVVSNTNSDQLSVLFGDGTGDFPEGRKTSVTAGSGVRGIGVLDLNGDGWDDIVTANRTADNLSIILNNGDGTFAPAVAKTTAGIGKYAIAVADANNDGLLDVFCSTFVSPYYIIVLLSDGEGGLVEQPHVSSGGRAWQIVVGDFNGDGKVDVASANSWTNNMGVLFGNGTGGFIDPVQTYPTPSFPLAIDAGDIDGDGDLELVTSNSGGKNWTVFENRLGSFINPVNYPASSAGSCAVLHDRDNDGDLDMSGFDEVDDWIYLFQNEPPTTGVKRPPADPVILFQNHPNPFNPATTIRFELARAMSVELAIFDASGARVTTLAHRMYPPGPTDLRWNGTDADGHRVRSGVYFYRLVSDESVLTRKMVLLK